MNLSGATNTVRLPWRTRERGVDPIIKEARDRQRRRRRGMLIAMLVLAAATYGGWRWESGGGSAPARVATSSARPAALSHEPGWYVGAARVPTPGCRGCVQTASWASTVPYLDRPNDFPQRTMFALGPHDVIVNVTRSWGPSEPRWALTRRPLHINPEGIHAGFEGNPTRGRVSVWLTSTWRNGSAVSVYIYFGAPHPNRLDVKRAQRELDTTRFPAWSTER